MAKTKATPTATPEQSNTGDQDKVIKDLLKRIREIEWRARVAHSDTACFSNLASALGYIERLCDEALEKNGCVEGIPF